MVCYKRKTNVRKILTQNELSNLSPEADLDFVSGMGALIGDVAGGIFEFMGRPSV
jgi:hypothetical protein